MIKITTLSRSILLAAFLTGLNALGSAAVSIQLKVRDPGGNLIDATGADIKLQIFGDSSGTLCLLREEVFSNNKIDRGFISLVAGTGTRTGSDPNRDFVSIFSNKATFSGLNCYNSDGSAAATTSYTPGSSDARLFRVSFSHGSETVKISFTNRSAPSAITSELARDSEKLGGKALSEFVQIPSGQTNYQSRLNDLVSDSGNTIMSQILAGTYQVPVSRVTATGTPSSSTYLRGDGTWAAISGSSGGTVTDVTGIAPITVINTTSTPAISIADATTSAKGAVQVGAGLSVASGVVSLPDVVTAGSLGSSNQIPVITVDAKGRVTGTSTASVSINASAITAGTLDDARIPALDAAKISTGTISSSRLPTNLVYSGQTGSVGIGSAADASSILTLAANNKGFLAPRMTTSERDAISAPATGLQIYNTTTNTINYFDGTLWKALNTDATSVVSYPSSTTQNRLLYSTANNTVGELNSANNSFLTTDSSGIPTWAAISADSFSQYALLAGRTGGQILYGGTAANNSLTLDSTSNASKGSIVINPTGGNVGIGATSPTASLHLRAGSTTANSAPLKFTAGTNLTTPEAGAIEFDGSNLYYTDSTNFRRTIASTTGISNLSNASGDITLSPAVGSGAVLVNSGAASNSSTTGALIVTGGTGVSGNANIGGSTTVSGNLSVGTAEQSSAIQVGDKSSIFNLAAPGAPIGTPSASGGSITTGTYYYSLVAQSSLTGGQTVRGTESSAVSVTGPAGSVSLTWTAVPGAVGYLVYRTSTSGTYSSPSYLGFAYTNSYTDTASSPNSGTPTSTDTQVQAASKLLINDAYTATGTNSGSSVLIRSEASQTANSTGQYSSLLVDHTIPATNIYNQSSRSGIRVNVTNLGSGTGAALRGVWSSVTNGNTTTTPGASTGVFGSVNYIGTSSVTATFSGGIFQASNDHTGSLSNLTGTSVTSTNSRTGSVTTQNGISATATNSSTGSVTTQLATTSSANNSSTGTVSTQFGGNFSANNSSSGAVTTQYGVRGLATNASGNVTYQHGGYFEASSSTSGSLTDQKGAYILASNAGSTAVTNQIGSSAVALNSSSAAMSEQIASQGSASHSGSGLLTSQVAGFFSANSTGSGGVSSQKVLSVTTNNTNGGFSESLLFYGLARNAGTTTTKQAGLSITLQQQSNSPVTNQIGNELTLYHEGSGTLTNQRGLSLNTENYAGGTVTNQRGIHNTVWNTNASGIVTTQYGIYNTVSNGSGTIDTSYGLFTSTINTGGTINNAYGLYVGSIAGTNKFSIYASDSNAPIYLAGNVGIGTSPTSEKLEVNGNVKATSFISTSDRRLKADIRKVAGLEIIHQLNGVSWNWKSTGTKDYGVIAQDVEAVMPEAVVTNEKNGLKAVKYQALFAPVIQAIKELKDWLSKQQSEIQFIDQKIVNLKAENQDLKQQIQELNRKNQQLQDQNSDILHWICQKESSAKICNK